MEESINPIVISAKPAMQHLEKIKSFHNDMLQNMSNQALRVKAFNDEKEAKQRDEAMRNTEINQKMAERTDSNQKAAMDYNLKTKELAIKEAALNQE